MHELYTAWMDKLKSDILAIFNMIYKLNSDIIIL